MGKSSTNGVAPPKSTTSSKVAKVPKAIYEEELLRLQTELVEMQEWVKTSGTRLVVVFEGRDAAGKGGTIQRVAEYLNPRICRIVALPAPTERQRTQWYFQRYVEHLPAAGEIVLFDRSWYNRAGVERVMGFCTDEQAKRFLAGAPLLERAIVDSGVILLKYWLEVGMDEQTRRLQRRIDDGRRIWKLSPMDIKSYDRWDDYTKARDEMFQATDSSWAPWFVVRSNHKRRARLNAITHILGRIPYKTAPRDKPVLPKRKAGKVKETNYPFKIIPEAY
jgi:polyphosphate kinase 2